MPMATTASALATASPAMALRSAPAAVTARPGRREFTSLTTSRLQITTAPATAVSPSSGCSANTSAR